MQYGSFIITQNRKRRPRYKNIFWYNPPFSLGIKTNLGKEFLKLVEKHFPPGSIWHKHFNRHTVKLSYSTTKNIASIVSSHNKKVVKGPVEAQGCNCRNKDSCPLDGACLTSGLVYLSTVDANNNSYGYWGSTANTFKERFNGHKQDMRNEDKPGTALSSKVHELKRTGVDHQIRWYIANKCHTLKPGQPICDVCITEKTRILLGHKEPHPNLPHNCQFLNKRSEIYAKCRHRARIMLRNCDKLY